MTKLEKISQTDLASISQAIKTMLSDGVEGYDEWMFDVLCELTPYFTVNNDKYKVTGWVIDSDRGKLPEIVISHKGPIVSAITGGRKVTEVSLVPSVSNGILASFTYPKVREIEINFDSAWDTIHDVLREL